MKTVLEMAREAEIHVYPEFEKAFERFANLIRADEREACAVMADECANIEELGAAIRARGRVYVP
jgi:uncharacterized membrane protein